VQALLYNARLIAAERSVGGRVVIDGGDLERATRTTRPSVSLAEREMYSRMWGGGLILRLTMEATRRSSPQTDRTSSQERRS
jgi:hypothetical protein